MKHSPWEADSSCPYRNAESSHLYFHNTPLLSHILKPREFSPCPHNSLFRSISLFFCHLLLRPLSDLFLSDFPNIGKHFLSLWFFLQGHACYVIRLLLMCYFTARKNVTLFPIFLGKTYMLIAHHMTILYLYCNRTNDRVFKDALSGTGSSLNWINAEVTKLRKTWCWPMSIYFLSGRFGDIKKLRNGLNSYGWCLSRFETQPPPAFRKVCVPRNFTLVEFWISRNFPTFNLIQVFYLPPPPPPKKNKNCSQRVQ
jgi:hypothetical protein